MTFRDGLGAALLVLESEHQGGPYRLYRSDPRFEPGNVDRFEALMRSGRYDGRYFTSRPHDAAIYYAAKDGGGRYSGFMLEALIGSDLTTDGHVTDSALMDGAGDEGALARAVASLESLDVPVVLIRRFVVAARGEDPGMARGDVGGHGVVDSLGRERVAHYYGSIARESVDVLKELFRWTGPGHLRGHGQVALLDRMMRGDEFVALHPYTIVGGVIRWAGSSLPVRPEYAGQFA